MGSTFTTNNKLLGNNVVGAEKNVSKLKHKGAYGSHLTSNQEKLNTVSGCSQPHSMYGPSKCVGGGSDWKGSAYSRGPINYPNNSWYNGKQLFRQFSKTGKYISNSDLLYKVAPISTGINTDKSLVRGQSNKWTNSFLKIK